MMADRLQRVDDGSVVLALDRFSALRRLIDCNALVILVVGDGEMGVSNLLTDVRRSTFQNQNRKVENDFWKNGFGK
jgi:hypothetical protein